MKCLVRCIKPLSCQPLLSALALPYATHGGGALARRPPEPLRVGQRLALAFPCAAYRTAGAVSVQPSSSPELSTKENS